MQLVAIAVSRATSAAMTATTAAEGAATGESPLSRILHSKATLVSTALALVTNSNDKQRATIINACFLARLDVSITFLNGRSRARRSYVKSVKPVRRSAQPAPADRSR